MVKKRKRLFSMGDRVRMQINNQWRTGTIIYIVHETGRIGVKFDGSSTGESVAVTRLQYEDGSLPDTIAEFGPSSLPIEDLGSV